MGIFRKAGRAFGKANMAVAKATTPSWRKQKPQTPTNNDPDFTGRDNVVNLRVKKGRETYDLLLDDTDVHVAYQSKEGKTKWRKTMSAGGAFSAIDPGSPPSKDGLNRHWAKTFKNSAGTYTGLDAQVKYLNDLGYEVQALDKRPVKAWRKGDSQASDRYVQEAMQTGTLSGDAEYVGPYVDPRIAHNTADREFRNKFFRKYEAQSREAKRGKVFDGTQWRKPPEPPDSFDFTDPGQPKPPPTGPASGPPPTGAGPEPAKQYSPDAQFILDIIAKRQKNPFQATNPKPPEQKPGDTPGPQPSQNQQQPTRQAIHIPGASGPLKYTGQTRPEAQPERPRKPLALYGKDELKQLTQGVLTRKWKFADESQKRSGPRSAWKPENPQKQLAFAPKPDDPASLERDPEALKFWEIFYRKKNEQSKIVEDVNAKRGRGKAGPLADTINVSRAQKVVIPGFWALDDLSPKQQAETSEKIKARAFGEANTSRAAAGMEIPGEITNDITKYTGKKAKGEATSEGQDRIYGGTQIAAGLQNELENVTDPELRQKMQSEIDRIIVQTEGLVEQKKLREQGKHYAANQKANELIDKLDPTGIIDAGRSVDPATGKSMPQIFATDAPTGVTDDIVQSANEAFGQFNKNLSNVSASGLRVMQVPSLWQKPGSTLEERMKQVPLAGETRAYPDDMMAPGEITDEKAIDRLMTDPRVIAAHASDKTAIPQGTGDPVLDEYVDAISNSMGSIRKYMESSQMLGGNFDPATRVLQSAQEYESSDGLSRTAAKGNYYTDKSANVRLFKAEEAATRSADDARQYWSQQALANPNPALAGIDRTLPPEEQRRQVRELAAQDIESILAKHADNYKNPQVEALDHPNIFQSVLASDKDALGLTAEDETPDVGPLADSILERLRQGRLDELEKIGDEGEMNIASVIDMFDRQGLQRNAAFYANLLEEQPTNPVAQNVASTTYNDMLNQGMTWPSNVRPDEKYVDPLLEQPEPAAETPEGPLPTYEELADVLPEGVNVAPDAAVAPPPISTKFRRRSAAQEQPDPTVQPPVELPNEPDTAENYINNAIQSNRYADRLKSNPSAMAAFRQTILDKWKQSILEQAKLGRLPDEILDSYESQFGRGSVGKTFRGIYEKGAAGYFTKDIRTNSDHPLQPPVEPVQPPAQPGFSLKSESNLGGTGAGRSMGVLFAQDTDLDRAARQGQYDSLEGQTSLLDNPTAVQEALSRADAVEAAQAADQPQEIVTDPNVKEKKLRTYERKSSGITNAPPGGILEWLSDKPMAAKSLMKQNGGEYDGMEQIPKWLQLKITTRNPNAQHPDQLLEELKSNDPPLIHQDATVSDMFEMIRQEHLKMPEIKQEKEWSRNFARTQTSRTTKGKSELNIEHLEPGDTFKIDGETFTFEGTAAEQPGRISKNFETDGYVISDGDKFGTRVIDPANPNIKVDESDDNFVSAFKKRGEPVLYKGKEWLVEAHDWENGDVWLVSPGGRKRIKAPLRGPSPDEIAFHFQGHEDTGYESSNDVPF